MSKYNFKNIIVNALTAIGLFIICSMFTYALMYNHKRAKSIETNAQYTIGFTKQLQTGGGLNWLTYGFNVNGISFNGEIVPGIDNYIVPNGRYVVEFSSKNPKYNKMLHLAIPDTIIRAPLQGWNQPPGMLYSVAKIENIVNREEATINLSYKMHTYYIKVKEDFLKQEDIGKNYYVSFYPFDMNYNTRIYAINVPDSIYWSAPQEGWNKKPATIK